jgi:hypothetical protein
MPIIGSFSFGSASATRYSTVNELLNQLPDNTANLIDASDVRDSVYSLWEYIGDVQTLASQSATVSTYYTNSTSVPVTIGGITAGMSFPGTYSMQQMWDMLLYPYIAPSCSFGSLGNRQFGAPLPVTLSWSVTKNTNTITSIIVDGVAQVPTGVSQAGTKAASSTHSVSPGVSQVNTFTMTCSDGTTTPGTSVNLTWMNKRYWGKVDLTSIGNPDLTTYPGLAGSVGAFLTDTVIKSLSGAGVGSGSELATTKAKTYTNMNGTGQHLVFAFPTSFGTPAFTVNGFSSNAFTKVRSASVFVNDYNFSGTVYDVWVSNTLQGSPLNIVIT